MSNERRDMNEALGRNYTWYIFAKSKVRSQAKAILQNINYKGIKINIFLTVCNISIKN